MFCPNCGTSVTDEYKFCYKCGAKLPLLNGGSIVAIENVSVQDIKLPIKDTTILDDHSKNNCQRINKKYGLLWRFLWGSKESSVVKCILMILFGLVISSVGYVLIDLSNMLDMQRGVREHSWAEFLIGYITHIIGMASVTRYVIILFSKVKSGVYEPKNYWKRLKACIVCLIFFVGWIMVKSTLQVLLEIDKPSFSVWEWIILYSLLRTAWRAIIGEKDCKKSVLQERIYYVILSIFLLCGLLFPIIFGVTTFKRKQSSTEKFIDHCNNGCFIEASRFIPSVDKNNATVQFYLGMMYADGHGVSQDDYEAVRWWRKAAEQGFAGAQHNLGNMYYNGTGVSKDEYEALKWYRKAAEQGVAIAQCYLGRIYANGECGVSKDEYEALKWYRKAANQGEAEAQDELGMMYYSGEGVTKDYYEAIKWWREAAKLGNASAQFNLGMMYANGDGVTQDDYKAVNWWLKAAEKGNVTAQISLSVMYAEGCGVTKDNDESLKWLRKAAEQGNASAQDNLGMKYAKGKGVAKDCCEAVKWYRKAAEQGKASAQFNLGMMYYNGEGVTKDYYEAVMWWRKAADQGFVNAQFNLGMMYYKGEGVAKDDYEAVGWWRKAAEHGNINAKKMLQKLGY